jgi:hypothetical protein
MSDTAPRTSVGAAQMLADALLRTLSGTSAHLRITGVNQDTNMSELGLVSTTFAEVSIGPVAMRKLRPTWQTGGQSKWELLVSATSIQQQVTALNLSSAQSLFSLTLAISIAEQDYLLETVASNEAFGQVYLYRLLLREAQQQAV